MSTQILKQSICSAHRYFLSCALIVIMCGASPGWTQDTSTQTETSLESRRHLRRLTLDLWGTLPTEEVLLDLSLEHPLELQDVERILRDPRAAYFFNRYHLDRYWPVLEIAELLNPASALLLPASFYGDLGPDADRLFLILTGITQRGGFVPCADEPAQFDADGELEFEDYPDGTRREGFVWITPYWSETPVKVCALEARSAETGRYGTRCDQAIGLSNGECGCGSTLERCASIESAQILISSFKEQVEREGLDHSGLEEGGPRYFELFTRGDEIINGPIAHYYRYIAPMVNDPIIRFSPIDDAPLSTLTFLDLTEWIRAERRAPIHSGILTSFPFLLRFPTARSRANRLSSELFCEPFVASGDRLPSPEDECSLNPDLSSRCGCSDCHARLEPLAAHWGRFADRGALYLNPQDFPSFDPTCAVCDRQSRSCSEYCRTFYTYESLAERGLPIPDDSLGLLKSYQWRTREEISWIEAGPSSLMNTENAKARLSLCTTVKLFEQLMARSPEGEDWNFIRELSDRFSSHENLAELTLELLMSPLYLSVNQAELTR